MAYTRGWSLLTPAGSRLASQIDDAIRETKGDFQDRMADLFGIVDFTTDPLKPQYVRVGAAAAGLGGQVRYTDDGGTLRWYSGILPGNGNRTFNIYDVANAAARLSIDGTTGLTTVSSGLTVNTTAGIALTVNGLANQWAANIVGGGGTGVNSGLIVQAGTNASDTAFEVTNAAGSPLFYIRGDGVAVYTAALFSSELHSTTFIGVGANTAASGTVRVPNAAAIVARNAANNADFSLVYLDSSNRTQISASGQLTNFSGDVTVVGNITASQVITASYLLKVGQGISGYGGQIHFLDDSGTDHWAVGIPGSVGARNFFVYDVARATSVLNVDPTTGVISGSFSGPLTGTVTGNVTGSSGSCTGNAATATTASNATNLGGVAAAAYAQLSGAAFTGDISVPHAHSMSAGAFYVI